MTKLEQLLAEFFTSATALALTADKSIVNMLRVKFPELHVLPSTDIKYDFVFIDNKLINSYNLDDIWNRLAYGATVYIDNFNYSLQNHLNTKCIQFLKNKHKLTVLSRQMLINGETEKFMIVKCFPESETRKITELPNTKPLIVVSVLKLGGIYNAEYVNRLANAVSRHLTIPYKFICITDEQPSKFNNNIHQTITFAQNYPKWWGKVELFRTGIFANHRVVYFDLDTLIIDNIDFMYDYTGIFAGLRDFYHMVTLGSGVMCWDGDDVRLHEIYSQFVNNAAAHMANNPSGDQQWINSITKHYLQYVQDYFPNKIVSFKKNCWFNNKITFPDNSAIVCFHGSPRMHELENDPKMQEHWY